MGFPGDSVVKNLPANAGRCRLDPCRGSLQGWEDPLEKKMATYSSTLAQKIPWAGEPGGLQFKGSQRVRHDLVAKQTIQKETNTILYLRKLRLFWQFSPLLDLVVNIQTSKKKQQHSSQYPILICHTQVCPMMRNNVHGYFDIIMISWKQQLQE